MHAACRSGRKNRGILTNRVFGQKMRPNGVIQRALTAARNQRVRRAITDVVSAHRWHFTRMVIFNRPLRGSRRTARSITTRRQCLTPGFSAEMRGFRRIAAGVPASSALLTCSNRRAKSPRFENALPATPWPWPRHAEDVHDSPLSGRICPWDLARTLATAEKRRSSARGGKSPQREAWVPRSDNDHSTPENQPSGTIA